MMGIKYNPDTKCMEVYCDRRDCGPKLFQYNYGLEAELIRCGWEIKGKKTYCPECKEG